MKGSIKNPKSNKNMDNKATTTTSASLSRRGFGWREITAIERAKQAQQKREQIMEKVGRITFYLFAIVVVVVGVLLLTNNL